MSYWHFTCDHRVEQIGDTLTPNPQPYLARLPLIWFSTSRVATRSALGLTSNTLHCDRMTHLYQVAPEDEHLVHTWAALKAEPWFAPYLPGARRLEAARGTRPILWAIATEPVRVFQLR